MKTLLALVCLGAILVALFAADPPTQSSSAKPPATAWLQGGEEEKFDQIARQLRGFYLAMMEVDALHYVENA